MPQGILLVKAFKRRRVAGEAAMRRRKGKGMWISTKGRYGLRMMLDIAVNSGSGPVPVKDVARREQLSDKYLEQIVTLLVKAGLVRSVRGAGGGYLLSAPAEQISVGQILRAVEGSLSPTDCVGEGREKSCVQAHLCATYELYREMKDAVDQVVDRWTLRRLMESYYQKAAGRICPPKDGKSRREAGEGGAG